LIAFGDGIARKVPGSEEALRLMAGDRFPPGCGDALHYRGILDTNACEIESLRGSDDEDPRQGLFVYISRINHACSANVSLLRKHDVRPPDLRDPDRRRDLDRVPPADGAA
jgi:hypothetical protein